MPCIEAAKVHLATDVATPDSDVTAYLGMALGLGTGSDKSYLIMDQLVSASDAKLDAASKKFAMALKNNDGNDGVEATASSFMDFGTTTSSDVRSGTSAQTI